MPTIDERLFTRITAQAGFSSLAATRYYTAERPATAIKPFAVGRVISAVRPQAMGSAPGNVRARVQITSFGDRPAQARALGEAVRLALHRWRDSSDTVVIEDVFLENELGPSFMDDSGLYEFMQDYIVFYRE